VHRLKQRQAADPRSDVKEKCCLAENACADCAALIMANHELDSRLIDIFGTPYEESVPPIELNNYTNETSR
jgi:hypothetical protein